MKIKTSKKLIVALIKQFNENRGEEFKKDTDNKVEILVERLVEEIEEAGGDYESWDNCR